MVSSATSVGPLGRRPSATRHTDSDPWLTVAPNVGAVGRSIGSPVLVDHDRIALHECLCVGDTVDSSATCSTTSTGSRSRRSKPRKPLDRVRRLHVAIDSLEDVGEQRVEGALHRVAEDERSAEERGAGHDGKCGQHDSSPTAPARCATPAGSSAAQLTVMLLRSPR